MSIGDQVGSGLNGKKRGRNWLCKCPAHDDSTASLSVSADSDLLVLKCFGGCTFEAVLEELIKRQIVEPMTRASSYEPQFWKKIYNQEIGEFEANLPTPNHDYLDHYIFTKLDGERAYVKVRFSPKTFRYYIWTEAGLKPTRPQAWSGLPWRLPETVEAIGQNRPIHWFEGEKDAKNALKFGLSATTLGGASEVIDAEYLPYMAKGRHVIWADNDKAGLHSANQFAHHLWQAGVRDIKLLTVPQNRGKDFSDWYLRHGCDREAVKMHLKTTPPWRPSHEQLAEAEKAGRMPKDIKRAQIGSENFAGKYFAHVNRSRLMYLIDEQAWYSFDKHWKKDSGGEHRQLAKDLFLQLREEMGNFDVTLRPAIEKIAERSQRDAGINAIVRMAATEDSVKRPGEVLDSKATNHLFNCPGMTWDLKKLEGREHSSEDRITRMSPFDPVFDVPEMFLSALHASFPGHPEVVQYLCYVLAYSLTGETGWQYFILLTGQAGSAKSFVVQIMKALLGNYYSQLNASSVYATKEASPAAMSDLMKAQFTRFISVPELDEKYKLNKSLIKALTGGDGHGAKKMHSDVTPLRAPGKIFFTANEFPRFDDDQGMARRLLEFRYEQKIINPVDDFHEIVLKKEAPQILGYLMSLASELYASNFAQLKEMPQLLQDWREESLRELDSLVWFFGEEMKKSPGGFIATADIFTRLEKFCRSQKLDLDYNVRGLGKRLTRMGLKRGQCASTDRRGFKDVAFIKP